MRLFGYERYVCLAANADAFHRACAALDSAKASSSKLWESLIYREVPLEELHRLVGHPAYDLSTEFLTQASQRGDRCFGVFHGAELVRYGFISTRPTPLSDPTFRIHFSEGWAYLYKALTLPAWRGQRLQLFERRQTLERLTQEGVRSFFAVVLGENYASLKSIQRLGFRPIASYWHLGKAPNRRVFGLSRREDSQFWIERSSN